MIIAEFTGENHRTPPPSFSPSHLLNLKTVQALLFRQVSLYIGFLLDPPFPLKIEFFSEPPYYLNFSSLTTSHLLKVTKFFVKFSRFKILVMTKKNIFVYKLFLLLNMSDFSLSFM